MAIQVKSTAVKFHIRRIAGAATPARVGINLLTGCNSSGSLITFSYPDEWIYVGVERHGTERRVLFLPHFDWG